MPLDKPTVQPPVPHPRRPIAPPRLPETQNQGLENLTNLPYRPKGKSGTESPTKTRVELQTETEEQTQTRLQTDTSVRKDARDENKPLR